MMQHLCPDFEIAGLHDTVFENIINVTNSNIYLIKELCAYINRQKISNNSLQDNLLSLLSNTNLNFLMLRFDRLTDASKILLKYSAVVASVQGQALSIQLLVKILPENVKNLIFEELSFSSDVNEDILTAILRTNLLATGFIEDVSKDGKVKNNLKFSSTIDRSGIYNLLPSDLKLTYHEKCAKALENTLSNVTASTTKSVAIETFDHLGHHFYSSKQWIKAVACFSACAQYYDTLGATNELLVYFTKAYSVLTSKGESIVSNIESLNDNAQTDLTEINFSETSSSAQKIKEYFQSDPLSLEIALNLFLRFAQAALTQYKSSLVISLFNQAVHLIKNARVSQFESLETAHQVNTIIPKNYVDIVPKLLLQSADQTNDSTKFGIKNVTALYPILSGYIQSLLIYYKNDNNDSNERIDKMFELASLFRQLVRDDENSSCMHLCRELFSFGLTQLFTIGNYSGCIENFTKLFHHYDVNEHSEITNFYGNDSGCYAAAVLSQLLILSGDFQFADTVTTKLITNLDIISHLHSCTAPTFTLCSSLIILDNAALGEEVYLKYLSLLSKSTTHNMMVNYNKYYEFYFNKKNRKDTMLPVEIKEILESPLSKQAFETDLATVLLRWFGISLYLVFADICFMEATYEYTIYGLFWIDNSILIDEQDKNIIDGNIVYSKAVNLFRGYLTKAKLLNQLLLQDKSVTNAKIFEFNSSYTKLEAKYVVEEIHNILVKAIKLAEFTKLPLFTIMCGHTYYTLEQDDFRNQGLELIRLGWNQIIEKYPNSIHSQYPFIIEIKSIIITSK